MKKNNDKYRYSTTTKKEEKKEIEQCIIKRSGVVLTTLVVLQIIAIKSLYLYKDIQANIIEILNNSNRIEELEKPNK